MIAGLLAMRSQSEQVMLNSFFASLAGGAGLIRGVSDRAFAKARSRLRMPTLESLNQN